MDYLKKRRKKRIIACVLAGAFVIFSVAIVVTNMYFHRDVNDFELNKANSALNFRAGFDKSEVALPKKLLGEQVKKCELKDNVTLKKLNFKYDLELASIDGCHVLEDITFEDGVNTYYFCIKNCDKVVNISLPNLVDRGYTGTRNVDVKKCNALTSLNIGDGHRFNIVENCISLKEITLNGDIYGLFVKGCSNLEKIYLPDDIKVENRITCDTDATFVVSAGSAAESYVRAQGFAYEYR